MARKDRYPQLYPVGFDNRYESEGSGSSGRFDTEFAASEDSIATKRKWVDLNSSSQDGFDVPVQVVPLSKLSPFEKKNLVFRLRSELEKIRLLRKKFEMYRPCAVTVSSSSDILSCSNVQTSSHARNSKKPSGSTSTPVKKSNSSLQGGWNRSSSGRFEPANNGLASNLNAKLLKQCENLLKKLMSHQFAWVFNKPVDVVALNIPDYFTVIKSPMDLGTIKGKLASGKYDTPIDFATDVRLTFSNAKTYNPPANNVHIWADNMSKFFEARWKVIAKGLPESSSQSLPEKAGIHEEAEVSISAIPTTKRKHSPLPNLGRAATVYPQKMDELSRSESSKARMSKDEKAKLIGDLEPLLQDLPDSIINFLKEQSSHRPEVGEDEIEIDFDDLQGDALFTLRKLLDEYLQEKRKNEAKAEACEIELPHESGPSTSSMQVDRGNGIMDEDADIGDNEPPVSSHPPGEVQKDAGAVDNECVMMGRLDMKLDSGIGGPSDGITGGGELTPLKPLQDNGSAKDSHTKMSAENLSEGIESISRLDQLEQSSLEKPVSEESDDHQDERPVSPERRYRTAVLINRFADTILKAREKTLGQGDKKDPETLRREREELEIQRKKEKARLQAEAKAAEEARKRAEAEAAAEVKRRRELEREAARQALLKIEKTVEINENSRFLEDLEMLSAGLPEQLPSDETSPDHLQEAFGSFKFGASNPLEQLGLYMKADEEEEEIEAPNLPEGEVEPPSIPDDANDDVEEGEID